MNYYIIVQAQPNGDLEVHNERCGYLKGIQKKKHLGEFPNPTQAVSEALKTFPKANGCYFCCKEVHVSRAVSLAV